MYMYMSSTPTSSWGTSSRDCYVKKDYWCNTHFLEQESVVPARTQGSLSYTRVSCGLRQSALIGNPRCRKINGYYKSFHREERSWGGRGQDRVCRCLGWGEEEEEEEEEECIPICEVGGEVQEILNLLIEDRCRRGCGAFNRRMLPESRAPRVGLGGGKSFMGESYCAERTVWVDRPCYGGKTDVGKGWDKFVRCERKEADEKQGRSKESLFNEEVMQSKSRSKVSFTGWRSRIRWISSLELDKEEERVEKGVERGVSGKSLDQLKGSVRWASGVGKGKYEERVQKGSKRTVVEKSWSKSRSNVRWDSAVDSQKEKEIVQEGNKKFGSGILSNGVGRSKVQFKETVHKATQTSNTDTSLSNWRDNMELSSTAGSNKQEEVEQERATKSGLKVYSNDLSNVSRFSIQEQKGRISLEKGENSVASFMTHENSRDQMVQRERGPCVPLVHSVCSGKISEQRSVTKSEERERVENSTEKMVAQQQDKVHAREQLENTLQRNKSEMFPGMPSDDSKKIAMQSSFTKLEAQETVKRTKEKLAFQKQDELTKSNGRTSIVELNKEKYQAEQNLETASQRFGTLMASNRTSEKLSKDWVSSGRSEVFSSGATGGKKASSVDYGRGNGASQHLFETSSYTPVYSELTQSGTGRNHSIRITEKTNRTSEDLFQTTSKTEVERLKSPADDEKGSKVSPKLPSDPSYKLSSNEVLQVSMESNKKKYASETETDTTSGKSAQTRLSYESNYSSGMVSAEGTDNHGSTEKISQESPLESRKPYLSSGDFPSEGPSEEVWAVAGWSSREEFEELQSSEKEKEEDSKILASEEPSDELQKNTEQQPIFESNKGQAATSKQNGKVIVKRRPSRGIWNSLIDFCGKGWGSHEESESSALKSSSGRPSTESPDSEGWFSVPELEDGECSMKEKADQDKRKIAAKRQGSVLISEAGENTAGGLKEAEKTQKEEVEKSAGKWSLEGSLEESQLTRRHISSTGHGGHGWQQRKEERTDVSVDPKKSQGRQQAKVQKAAINWSSEGISADEIQLSTGPLSSGVDEKLDQIEKEKGKAAMVGKDELEEHEDTQRLIQSSEIEEKKKMTKQIKRNKQIPKETFTLWEEALIFESQQRQEDEKFMREALSEARMASDAWEVPIGAVLVQNGKIIARAHNLVEETRDATAHAEMLCIRYASNQLRTWRLAETTLYVTLEPCPMCAGAILQARIGTVVWGAPNKLLGADGSWVSLFPREHDEKLHGTSERPHATGPIHPFHPNIKIRRSVLASDCSDIMQQFFKLRRKREKKTQSNSCFSLKNYPSKLFTKLHEIFSVFCL